MSDENAIAGSCLCGAVNLSTTNKNNHIGACHCSMCRRWGGGPFLAVEYGSEVSFSGKDNIEVYSSSQWGERGFCKKCGSHLFYRYKPNNQYYISVGLFNRTHGFVFDHQVFVDNKPEYYSFANKTKNMTEAEVFAEFAPPPDGR